MIDFSYCAILGTVVTLATMTTQTLPRIHFFRPGRHTAMSGQTIEFTADDLAKAARAYDPAVYMAPIVVGHPAIDAPAYGWVRGIQDESGELYAQPDQVEPQFTEMVKAGRYKKVSAAWFTPSSPNNPAPGSYYLKHIGFLGAAAPAVQGLKPVTFAADKDDLVIEFAFDGHLNASLWRRLREWLIGKEGMDTADMVVPYGAITMLEDASRTEDEIAPTQTSFAIHNDGGDAMSDADKARLAELEAENAALKAAQAEAKRLAVHVENAAFAEAQVTVGRLTPALSQVIVQVLDVLASLPEPPQFGEGDAAKPLIDALKTSLAAGPVVVDFGEHSAPNEEDAVAAFTAPHGYHVDPDAAAVHARAMAYIAAHPDADYIAAVKAVS